MADKQKETGKRSKTANNKNTFGPSRAGFAQNSGYGPGNKSGGYRGKNTPANWRRFNP